MTSYQDTFNSRFLKFVEIVRNLPNCNNSEDFASIMVVFLRLKKAKKTNLVLAISGGIDANVVARPLIILAQKWQSMLSWKYPVNNTRQFL